MASSTNERTLISTITHPNVFIGNSMNHIIRYRYELINNKLNPIVISYSMLIYEMALFNSLILNYYIRNKISANLNMFFIYELPIAEADGRQRTEIIKKAFSLLYRKSNRADFEDLRKELYVEPDEETDLIDLRAALEVLIAKELYGLKKMEWEYICSTFIYGEDSETRKELEEIISRSIEMY